MVVPQQALAVGQSPSEPRKITLYMGCINCKSDELQHRDDTLKKVYLDKPKQIDVRIARGLAQIRPELTKEQRAIIQSSWDKMRRDMLKVGIIVFGELFEKNYFVRRTFLQHTENDIGRGREMLKRHVHKVMLTVDKAVTMMDDESRLAAHLFDAGAKHVQRNVRIEILDLLVPAFMRSLEPTFEHDYSREMEDAWATFLKYVVQIMKESMVF